MKRKQLIAMMLVLAMVITLLPGGMAAAAEAEDFRLEFEVYQFNGNLGSDDQSPQERWGPPIDLTVQSLNVGDIIMVAVKYSGLSNITDYGIRDLGINVGYDFEYFQPMAPRGNFTPPATVAQEPAISMPLLTRNWVNGFMSPDAETFGDTYSYDASDAPPLEAGSTIRCSYFQIAFINKPDPSTAINADSAYIGILEYEVKKATPTGAATNLQFVAVIPASITVYNSSSYITYDTYNAFIGLPGVLNNLTSPDITITTIETPKEYILTGTAPESTMTKDAGAANAADWTSVNAIMDTLPATVAITIDDAEATGHIKWVADDANPTFSVKSGAYSFVGAIYEEDSYTTACTGITGEGLTEGKFNVTREITAVTAEYGEIGADASYRCGAAPATFEALKTAMGITNARALTYTGTDSIAGLPTSAAVAWADTDTYDPDTVGEYRLTPTTTPAIFPDYITAPASILDTPLTVTIMDKTYGEPAAVTAVPSLDAKAAYETYGSSAADIGAWLDTKRGSTTIAINDVETTGIIKNWILTGGTFDPKGGTYTFTGSVYAADRTTNTGKTVTVEVTVTAVTAVYTELPANASYRIGTAPATLEALKTALGITDTRAITYTGMAQAGLATPATLATSATITWADTDSYDPATVGSYRLTPTTKSATFPTYIVAPAPVDTALTVTITDKTYGKPASVAAVPNLDAKTAYETYGPAAADIGAWLGANRGSTAIAVNEVEMTGIIKNWHLTNGVFDPQGGTYTFTGSVYESNGITNTGKTVMVEVTVTAVTAGYGDLSGANASYQLGAAPATIADLKTAMGLTDTRAIVYTGAENIAGLPISATVTWADTDNYNPNMAGAYRLTPTTRSATFPTYIITSAPVDMPLTATITDKTYGEPAAVAAVPSLDAKTAYETYGMTAEDIGAWLDANRGGTTIAVNGEEMSGIIKNWTLTDGVFDPQGGTYTFMASVYESEGTTNTGKTVTVEVTVTAVGGATITADGENIDISKTVGESSIPQDMDAVIALLPSGILTVDLAGEEIVLTGLDISDNDFALPGNYSNAVTRMYTFSLTDDAAARLADAINAELPIWATPITPQELQEQLVQKIEIKSTTPTGGGGGGGGASTQYYSVKTSVSLGGTVALENSSVASGRSTSFTITPASGYTIDAVTVTSDGKELTPVMAGNKYTIDNITADVVISVTFKAVETGNYLTHHLFITGYPDGAFKPDNNLTRAEVAMIFARFLTGMDDIKPAATAFVDVDADAWYSGAVKLLADERIIEGYEDGTYKPDAYVTRAEFVTLVARFFEWTIDEGVAAQFSDIADSWAQKYIAATIAQGSINGYPDGTFKPNDNITRAEAVKVLVLALDRDPTNAVIMTSKAPSDVAASHWSYKFILEAMITHVFELVDGVETWREVK